MILHLVRHAECLKNLVGIPGGDGTPLTARGVAQAASVAVRLQSLVAEIPVLVACPSVQTVETAELIGQRLGLTAVKDSLLTSIHLGELAGIQIGEARRRYPESSRSMDLWREGRIEINQLEVAGMEDPWIFFRRGIRFILNHQQEQELIVCCTTSIMILLCRLIQRVTPAVGDGYRVLHFHNVEHITLDVTKRSTEWLSATYHDML